MGSPLTLGKSKRWLARRRVTCEAPDRCEARECVQERRRAATKRRITQALFFLRSARRSDSFVCAGFSVPPLFCPRHAGNHQQAQLAHHCLCQKLQLAPCFCTLQPHSLSAVIMISLHYIMQHVHMSLHSIRAAQSHGFDAPRATLKAPMHLSGFIHRSQICPCTPVRVLLSRGRMG